MYPENFRQRLSDLIHTDAIQRENAHIALRSLDEEIVDPLIGEFYSGVSERLGISILELVAEIGGPDALSLLRNVYHFDDKHVAWRDAVRRGLLHNSNNLDASELTDLLRNIES
jgi:hypothetical protein